ncbi:DUF4339 domain-containing protein [Bacteriovorax sp. Seq25_V]|uniref:DUF4339 domain-containing protein n=1 Tax=Bacteriovorax sp. Seq25_V TaxID=1201288 RepID=UPI00038A36A4|nr:DUF4339 domain-containing protein [Bacteriovorax sp. Seq25_V]EQC44240.1 hypothetical protein M900_A0432 [Bacteriovorax sp. Seq25_V]
MGNALKNDQRKSIEDYLLTQEQIDHHQYPSEEIYEILVEGKVIGPFWNIDLKDFLADANLYSEETKVKNVTEAEWTSVYSHPYFQRRRPALVSTQNLAEAKEDYYLLIEGKKEGPYTTDQIKAMLATHKILPIDFISIDNGSSWGKIHDIEGFDRREKTHQNLPFRPDGHIFTNSIYDADRAITKAVHNASEKDALVGLAYVGHLNEGKKKHHIEEMNAHKNVTQTESEGESSSTMITFLFALVAFAGIYYFYQTMSGKPEVVTKTATPVSKKEFTQTKATKPQPTARKSKPTRAPARAEKRPALEVTQGRTVTRSSESIRDAEFAKKEMQDESVLVEVPPEAIFDDATEAVELDPIRQRVSKDTIDPELTNQFDENMPLDELEDISRNLGPIDEDGNPIGDTINAEGELIE